MGNPSIAPAEDRLHWRLKAATLREYANVCETTGLTDIAQLVREVAERCRQRALATTTGERGECGKMLMAGVRLGSWRCRSGNSLDLYLEPDAGTGTRALVVALDSPPPLSDADLIDYVTTIRPWIVARAAEYLEVPTSRVAVLCL